MTEHARIVAAFGRQFEVETASGQRLLCVTRGKKNDYACGDEVGIRPTSNGQGVIVSRAPRRSLLHRSDAFREKLLAANLSQVLIVVATEPGFSDELISRCLCAAEDQHLRAVIVLNKVDLADKLPAARERLAMFATLGYPVVELSAHQDASALRPWLDGHCSILVGQSGMGKSSLLNALVPGAAAATREISAALDTGKHTTTFARLYALDANSTLIDSPGLQAFGLAHLDPQTLAECFVEFRPLLGQCRFRDCRHQAEPGCALRAALEAGSLHPRRFAHFQTLQQEIAAARAANPGW